MPDDPLSFNIRSFMPLYRIGSYRCHRRPVLPPAEPMVEAVRRTGAYGAAVAAAPCVCKTSALLLVAATWTPTPGPPQRKSAKNNGRGPQMFLNGPWKPLVFKVGVVDWWAILKVSKAKCLFIKSNAFQKSSTYFQHERGFETWLS
jgi:hypothetical protein